MNDVKQEWFITQSHWYLLNSYKWVEITATIVEHNHNIQYLMKLKGSNNLTYDRFKVTSK